MKKKNQWMKFRHRIVKTLAYLILTPYSRIMYGVRVMRLPKEKRKQCLILYNHQTPFDQFFVGMAVRGPIYYLATEDVFSNGWVSSLVRFLVAPIPIKKGAADVRAVLNCIRVAREGGTIAIAPEGNRTYSGKTEHINPSITDLILKLRLPVAFFRIEGGYGAQPRWSDVIRRGTMRAYFSRVMEPEEAAAMGKEELYDTICRELYVNEAKADGSFRHKKSAEYLERAVYVCPDCGLAPFESRRDTVTCQKCGKSVRYLPTKELEGVGTPFPFRFFNEWYEYQNGFVNRLDLPALRGEVLFTDTADISRVIVYQRKVPLAQNVRLSLCGDGILLEGGPEGTERIGFDEIAAMSVLGRNKLNIDHHGEVWQLRGGKRFNALKYMNLYYRYRNLLKGNLHGEFLGL